MAESDLEEQQPAGTQFLNPSSRKYVAVFLFTFDVNLESPFVSVTLDNFEGSDFPFHLISGHLGLGDRLKARILPGLPDKKYSVFAKCEEGMT